MVLCKFSFMAILHFLYGLLGFGLWSDYFREVCLSSQNVIMMFQGTSCKLPIVRNNNAFIILAPSLLQLSERAASSYK